MRQRKSQNAFTLIELSIVLGIMALLSVAMIPCFKASARIPLMQATIKKIEENAKAFRLMYASSSDGSWPGYDSGCRLNDPSAVQTGITPFHTPINNAAFEEHSICTLKLEFHVPRNTVDYITRFLPLTACTPPSKSTGPEDLVYCVKLVLPPLDAIALHSANHP